MSKVAEPTEATAFEIAHEIRIDATREATFAAILQKLGPDHATPDGTPIPMVLEAFPGGRWYRDLGQDDGHCWGHVQAIRRHDLVELSGPLFMSYPVSNNIQYRIEERDGGTLLRFRHSAWGMIEEAHRDGMDVGWQGTNQRIKEAAENA